MSCDETSPVSSSGLGEGLSDSDNTVLFHSCRLPSLVFLVGFQETEQYFFFFMHFQSLELKIFSVYYIVVEKSVKR